jgi:hypothetical protein
MTTKQDFSDDEWARLIRAPLVAGLAISIADPGGPIEMAKEVIASLKAMRTPPTNDELVVEVAREISGLAERRENPIGDFRPKGPDASQEVLNELRAVASILEQNATSEEAQAFRNWVVDAARAAADAAKEGGFMGFGAEQVSAGERTMLDEVRAAIGLPREDLSAPVE